MRRDPSPRPDSPSSGSALLIALRLGDSFFPSGGSAFSWGLESLHADGKADGPGQVFELLCALIEQRWAGFDRPLLRAAHEAAAGLDPQQEPGLAFSTLIELDATCEAMTLSSGARAASRRLGFTQLRVQGELGVAVASVYLQQVRAGHAAGHLPIVQGLVWQALGLPLHEAEAISAFSLCTAVAGAAIRLGLLGHIDAQRLLLQMASRIELALAEPAPPLDALWTATPAVDIAAMRHEPRTARLFAN